MKKIFLLLAFTGIVGAASANTVLTLSKGTVIAVNGDDKKGDDKKKPADKEKAACCKKEGAGKSCAGEKEGKSCCKGKPEAPKK